MSYMKTKKKKKKSNKNDKTIIFILKLIIIASLLSFVIVCFIKYEKEENLNIIKTEYKKNNKKTNLKKTVTKFEVTTKKVYLAKKDTKQIVYNLETTNNYKPNIEYKSNNENIATVSDTGLITSKNNGSTTIDITVDGKLETIEVLVTSLISKMPKNMNNNKNLLSCERYSKEENDLLDEILASRINEAGYKTRAGAVAAARFITLEFPYKLGYFSENGRAAENQPTYYVDGEGRYYHVGLYLHSSRFKNITKSMYGPNIWGCKIYSIPSEGKRNNSFDCSGYITWVLLNGWFDPGDVGAGVSDGIEDLTDIGEKKKLSTSIKNNELKAGDLLSGPHIDGGHIAMIMGLRDGKYIVTECLWGNGDYGVIVRTYSKTSLQEYFKWHIDLDTYYKEDGNYTEDWI